MVGKYENKNQDIRKKWFCILNVGFLIENEKKNSEKWNIDSWLKIWKKKKIASEK